MRLIDADELLERLKDVKDGYAELIEYGVELAMDEITDMLKDGEYVSDVVPADFHEHALELEVKRRFAAEERLKAYHKTLDAIREELAATVVLVDRLKESTDCKTCPHADKNGLCGHWEHKPCELDEIDYE